MHWYLVKRNWEPILQVLRSSVFSGKITQYIGVGGDVWPLDMNMDAEAKHIHERVMKSRKHIPVGEDLEACVCVDLCLAQDYYSICASQLDNVMLLEAWQLADSGRKADGLDFGSPSGGYSVIETEIIMREDMTACEFLNSKGLFVDERSMATFVSRLEQAPDSEDLTAYNAFHIRIITPPEPHLESGI